MNAAVLYLLAKIAAELDRAKLDRAVGLIVTPDKIRHLAKHRLFRHFFGGKFFRRRHVRHLILVVERALLVDMKRHHDREDLVAMLDRGDPSGRITLAVA